MPQPFRFPRNPNANRRNPFVDEQGRNPFADDAAPASGDSAADSPVAGDTRDPAASEAGAADDHVSTFFAGPGGGPATGDAPPAGAAEREPAYRPRDFEQTLDHRGRLIRRLGVLSLLGTAAGTVGAGALLLTTVGYEGLQNLIGLYSCSLFSLAAGIPCWVLGMADLRAMRAGAMDPAGERKTRQGLWLGIGTVCFNAVLFTTIVLAIALTVVQVS